MLWYKKEEALGNIDSGSESFSFELAVEFGGGCVAVPLLQFCLT